MATRRQSRPGRATGASAKAERPESQSLGGDGLSEGGQQPAPLTPEWPSAMTRARAGRATPLPGQPFSSCRPLSPSAATLGPREASDPTERSEVACVRCVRGLGAWVETGSTALALEGGAPRRSISADGACSQEETGA